MESERAYWLAWAQISGIGPILLQRLRETFGDLITAWRATPTELGQVAGLGSQLIQRIEERRRTCHPLEFLDQHEGRNPQFLTPADPDYPYLVRILPDPPPVLYTQGQILATEAAGRAPTVAVVGTRHPSPYGRRWTERLVEALTHKGWTIVSGLAEGIDTEAHRSCLKAAGRTLAVLGTGLDQVYPASNRHLQAEVATQGLLVSEHPAGTPPDRGHFPRRNRIIAALSRAVILTEAPTGSGALITAQFAADYGRDVYVLPGSLDNPQSQGCLELIQQGAQVILGVDHLLELLGDTPALDTPSRPQPPPPALELEPAAWQVLEALGTETLDLDTLVATTGLPVNQVSTLVLELELLGVVRALPGLRYERAG
ncbi:MAG: DNA-protecting protein DprA [Gloeomargaritaceae cyanobacterium C42_A2020_066]|nr:DNA-protecting protein DprA [Gloeomargaritaceae cyanobacterium C42_A2020_066]